MRCPPPTFRRNPARSPYTALKHESFSARWDGEIEAQFSEPYAFHVTSDDRARLWVDGQLLIDEWYEHAEQTSSALIQLQPGRRYAVRLDYFQHRGAAIIKFAWSSPSTPEQVVPQTQLYSKFTSHNAADLEKLFQAELNPAPQPAVSPSLPLPWSDQDVGPVGLAGTAQVQNGNWSITGAGADIWANSDGFHFVYQSWQGDGQIVARVTRQDVTDPWAKGGIMIRETLRSDARHLMLAVTPANGVRFFHRFQTTGETTSDPINSSVTPVWMKLVRRGNAFSAYTSADGLTWQWAGTESIALPVSVFFGLVVNSHDNSTLGTVAFDQVSVGVPLANGIVPAVTGTGDGLLGTYSDGASGQSVSRIDPTVNFDWDSTSPTNGIGPDNFSARWEGFLEPQYNETYLLHVLSDDGARFWLDGQLLIDAWTDHAASEASVRVDFKTGLRHTIKLEYFQRTGEAVAKLLWSSPSTPKQPIPQSQLYSTSTPAQTAPPSTTAAIPGQTITGITGAISDSTATNTVTSGAVTAALAGVTGVTNAVELPGAAAVARLGQWQTESNSIYAIDRRGYLEYDLAAPAPDIYRIEIEGGTHGTVDLDSGYYLAVSLDGEYLGRLFLDASPGHPARVQTLTPFVQAGTHRLRVYWDNARKGRSLALSAIRLQVLLGPDADKNGKKDWVEALLAATSGIGSTPAASSPIPITSLTSPACLEGRGGYLSMMQLQDGTGAPITPQPGVGDRWYANVALTAGGPNLVQASFQNGGRTETGAIIWQAVDLPSSGDLTIRQGDSLQFAVGAAVGAAQIQVGAAAGQVSLPANQTVVHLFDQTGSFTVGCAYADASGAQQSRTIHVTVLGSATTDPVAAWVGHPRLWNWTGLPSQAIVEADPRLSWTESTVTNGSSRQFSLTSDAPENRYLTARAGVGGPILSSALVNGFNLFSGNETDLGVAGSLSDGSLYVDMTIVESPVLAPVSLRVSVFVGGVTFDDGSVVKLFQASDFDPLGQITVRFIRPATLQSATCHVLKAFQHSDYLGTPF